MTTTGDHFAAAAVCTYHPCRNFGRVPDAASPCSLGELCPLRQLQVDEPRGRPYGTTVMSLIAALALTMAFVRHTGRSVEREGGRTPTHDTVQAPAVDYQREVEELTAFSRQILEKTQAIRIFNEQLTDAYVPMDDERRATWRSSAARKKSERDDLCTNMIKKVVFLNTLDHGKVDAAFAQIGMTAGPLDIEARRYASSVSLARATWKRVNEGNLRTEDIIGDAARVMPWE